MIQKPTYEELKRKNQELEQAESERRQVEEALKQSEERYRSLIENTMDGYFICEIPSGQFLFLNKKACSFFGYTMEEGLKLTVWNVMSPEDHERIQKRIQARLENKALGSELNAYTAIRKNGATFRAEISTSLVTHRGVHVVQGIIRDITERQQAEEALLQVKERTETILQTIQSGVLVIDKKTHNILDINRAAEIMIGATREEIIGHICHRFVCPTKHGECPITDIGEKANNTETVLLRKDGSQTEILKTVASATLNGRECLIESFLDIKDLKQAEEVAKAHQERFKKFFSSVNDAIFVHPLKEEGFAPFIEVNNIACERYGYSRDEFLKLTAPDITKKEDANAHSTSKNRKKLLDAKHLVFESIHIKKSGEKFPVEINSNIIEQYGQPVILAVVRDISERKQAEVALKENRERMELALKGADLGMWDYNILSDEVILDQRSIDLMGAYPKTEAEVDALMHPDDIKLYADAWDAALAGKEDFILQYRVKSHSGQYKWLMDKGKIIKNSNDKPIRAVGTVQDITQSKKTEVSLKQSAETINSIFKAAPVGIGMVHDRIITQANDRLYEMVGRSAEELLHMNARILYPTDEDYEYVGQAKYDQIKKKGTGSVETRWQHKNGEILDILLSSTPIDAKDWSQGVTFSALDITNRKQAEKKLLSSHEMFLTVLDSIDATIYVADMNTYEILFMNKYMIESFGSDLTGKTCWDVFRNEAAPCKHCTNNKLIDIDGEPTGVYVWQDENPITGKWYINHDRAIKWVDDRLVRIQIATDITDIKQLERQLQQSQKMEAIGILAGGIAHDFNNILSAVIGYSELSIEDAEKNSQLENNLIEIRKAGLRARNLVKQILTFARKADRNLRPVNLTTIAKEVRSLLRSTLPASIEIKSLFKSDSMVIADETQIHQIFMNLCTNAAQAMKENGGILEIGLSDIEWTGEDTDSAHEMEPGGYLRVTIADTGVGISAQNLPLIFEPYFTTKKTGEGTGLGLSVVHGIVKGYGGEIIAESELSRGTVFTIYLPIIKKDTERKLPEAEALEKGNERVLFIDDELPICEMGSQMLERLGYCVTAKSSSVEALTLFRSKPNDFDIVITDMTMPKLNGDKFAAELMAIRPDIPIILCTGYSQTMSSEKAAGIGIMAFAMKPLTLKDLAKTVRKVLDSVKK